MSMHLEIPELRCPRCGSEELSAEVTATIAFREGGGWDITSGELPARGGLCICDACGYEAASEGFAAAARGDTAMTDEELKALASASEFFNEDESEEGQAAQAAIDKALAFLTAPAPFPANVALAHFPNVRTAVMEALDSAEELLEDKLESAKSQGGIYTEEDVACMRAELADFVTLTKAMAPGANAANDPQN